MDTKKLQETIETMKKELAERESALPAHSARPHQLMEIEDLEERIEEAEGQLAKLPEDS